MFSKQLVVVLAFVFAVLHGGASANLNGANIIDRCRRRQRNWAANRQRLAVCSVGYAGKMRQNRGPGVVAYTVTDPGDDPVRPRPGTLRYGATVLPGKVWITIRHGYAHVVNNFYDGWRDYAIGGSMGPSVKSQGNLFVACGEDNKKVTRRMPMSGDEWDWHSIGDSFQNSAFFKQTGSRVPPNYNKHQVFPAASSDQVRSLTKDAGALRCSVGSAC
ncbi:hypothetical protein PR202_gb23909 [Eleusine coracana subsp. coracana]|uniref:Uncharacterized protein n=1 Tax=Eleusine coracana subsp. coracana TaxID=191504 RepID=A0AAV5FJV3_ELECO|nr:hypothetical protein PR202_gb23909 [Eleusine coracana subsp. coracana]